MSEERFATAPPLPDRIHRLHELALDLWWSWDARARELFRRLDYTLWRATAHNPVKMLQQIGARRLWEAATDPNFLEAYDQATFGLDQSRMLMHPWWQERAAVVNGGAIAYFSAEFALHQSLPIYAGGLGVLAGDHCKEAADMGVPLVGVGFMYPQGYFHQRMSNEGWQEERYENLSWTESPIETAITPDGRPCVTAVPLGGRTVLTAVWRVRLGRVRLFLLDTDLQENAPWDRELSARLYGGDRETRIQQEIILGIGGVRVLRALGINPTVWHLNEGHAAFVGVQRIRDLVEKGQTFEAAVEEVRRSTVFTTHTPVPAGHDQFPLELVDRVLRRHEVLAMREVFCCEGALNMTFLALNLSHYVNGVAKRHREVSQYMFARYRIDSITNGVHAGTWVAPPLARLFDHHIPGWREDNFSLRSALSIPPMELWQAHQAAKRELIGHVNRQTNAGLDADVLTLGFARRATTCTLPLPTIVTTLSGVTMVVPKRPTSRTVPETPPALTKSPALKGRSTTRKTPAAKWARSPLQAMPIATPAAATSAAKVVVSTPK
jgi:starch phosphorylase